MPGRVVIPTGAELQGPILSDFVPQMHLITSVTQGPNAIVTTQDPHGYYTNMFVRVNVPPIYGMTIFEQTQIVVLSATMFQTQINTSNMNSFIIPNIYPPLAFTPAQVVPITGQEMNIATPEV